MFSQNVCSAFYLQSFCASDSTHVTATKFALALPPEKYQFTFYNCVNSDCTYTNFVPRAARRARSCGSPLTVKTISYLWELEWLAECSPKVWKFSGSGRYLSTSRLHLGASQTFCLRFHMFLYSSVLIKLKYDLRGKKIFTWLMVRPLRGLNSCITW